MIIGNYLADKNEPEILRVSGSFKFTSWTKNPDGSITHFSGLETSIEMDYPEFVQDRYYVVVFEVTVGTNSGVRVAIGNTDGTQRIESGTYIETLKFKGPNKITFYAYGDVTIKSISVEEYVVYAKPLDFTDKEAFVNHSWTLSFSIPEKVWVSFHSNIPDFYLTTPTDLYSLVTDELSVENELVDEYKNPIVDHNGNHLIYKTY